MRTSTILGVILAVVLIPQVASATCLEEPFDQIVRSSDPVLVGTVADATVTHGTQVVVRLDVGQVLSGSADDGRRVAISGCGPPVGSSEAKQQAKQMIGTRGLYLMTRGPGGIFYTSNVVATPPGMTLQQRIARAHEALGRHAPDVSDRSGLFAYWPLALTVILVALGIGALVTGAVFATRRARRA